MEYQQQHFGIHTSSGGIGVTCYKRTGSSNKNGSRVWNGINCQLWASNSPLWVIIYLFSYVVSVDCVWGEYGEWSTCSATCGGGSRTRTRPEATPASNGGAPCTASATETGTCNPNACSGSKTLKARPKQILNAGVCLLIITQLPKYFDILFISRWMEERR